MAHLLGGRECVESLRRDVIDLQGALVEVFSRTGPVCVPSWKFPDKVGFNLDLVALLQQYDYVEGELEFNQHSHVVLLELVIDRLLLLLQSFNTYTQQMIGDQRPGHSAQPGASACIGPAVKRYWNSLVQFSSRNRQARFQSAGSPRTQSSTARADPQPSVSGSQGLAPQCRSVSSQTLESSLVPCDACAHVQAALKDSACVLASLCAALDLPCSLRCLLEAMDETLQAGRLSACDLALWACEQKKDLGRIQRQVIQVTDETESLRERLQEVEEERESVREELTREQEARKGAEEERDSARAELTREQERKTRDEEERRNTTQETKIKAKRELRRQRDQLTRAAEALEMKISGLEEELKLQREEQLSFSRDRESLLEDVHRLRLLEMRWTEEKTDAETEISNTKKLLDMESAKNCSVQRQHQALQVKQRSLLDRVGALVQECETLQSRLDECEDEKAALTKTLAQSREERDTLQKQLSQQESQCAGLKEDRQFQCVRLGELEDRVSRLTEDLQRAAEREKILVAFPELNHQHRAPQSTGDVLLDMEQQVKANVVRILVLEQENASLTSSLSRLKQARPQSGRDADDSETSAQDASVRTKEEQIVSSASAPSSFLHRQTLRPPVGPDAELTYGRLRRAARARSAGTCPRRK